MEKFANLETGDTRPDVCGVSGRSATKNVGPILLGSGIIALDTSEHISQKQPNVTPNSNFPKADLIGIENSEIPTKPLSATTDTFTIDTGNNRGNAYLVKRRSQKLTAAKTDTQLIRAVHQNGDLITS